MKQELTAERLRELLHYEPETGVFTWRASRNNNQRTGPGAVAGNQQSNGYVYVKIDGRSYFAHRLASLWQTGEWPPEHVDHIDGDRSNNRWCNLRHASRELNAQNQRRAHPRNQAGLLGAHKRAKGFGSEIRANGIRMNLGCFKTAEEAHAAYLEAKRRVHEGNTL